MTERNIELLKNLKQHHHIGFVNEKQYNLIERALMDEHANFVVDYKPYDTRNGKGVKWTVTIDKVIE